MKMYKNLLFKIIISFFFSSVFAVILSADHSVAEQAENLQVIKSQETKTELEVIISAENPVIGTYQSFFEPDDKPPKLIIDIEGNWKNTGESSIRVGNEIVTKVRIGKHSDWLRVVFDLNIKEDSLFYQIQKKKRPFRLTEQSVNDLKNKGGPLRLTEKSFDCLKNANEDILNRLKELRDKEYEKAEELRAAVKNKIGTDEYNSAILRCATGISQETIAKLKGLKSEDNLQKYQWEWEDEFVGILQKTIGCRPVRGLPASGERERRRRSERQCENVAREIPAFGKTGVPPVIREKDSVRVSSVSCRSPKNGSTSVSC